MSKHVVPPPDQTAPSARRRLMAAGGVAAVAVAAALIGWASLRAGDGVAVPSVDQARAVLPPVPDIAPQAGAAAEETVTCAALKTDEAYRGKSKIFKYILPGTNGWMFRSSDFRTDFALSDKAFESFRRMNDLLAARGTRLVVLLQPPRGLFAPVHMAPDTLPEGYDAEAARESYRAFIRRLEDHDIAAVDLSDVSPDAPYFMKADPHWSVAGARLTAEKAAETIAGLDAYESVEKKRFSTRIVGQEKHERGDYEEFALKTCKKESLPISVDIWETSSDTETATDAALFGDAPLPAIVALGTSNTENDRELNFVGSLKSLISADIYNAALAGGGFGGSPLAYFVSDAWRSQPPKVVIWEFLAHHDFEDFTAFRQILPSIGGACTPEEALATYEGPLNSPPPMVGPLAEDVGAPDKKKKKKSLPMAETVLFEGLNDTLAKAEAPYLYFETSDILDRTLQVEILYSNGDAEQVDVTRSSRIPDNGKYFLSLDLAPDAVPLIVQIGTDNGQGRISARLCGGAGGKLAARKE